LAATSEELSGQAEALQQSIAFFKTSDMPVVVSDRHAAVADRRASPPRLMTPVRPAAVRGGGNSNFRPF